MGKNIPSNKKTLDSIVVRAAHIIGFGVSGLIAGYILPEDRTMLQNTMMSLGVGLLYPISFSLKKDFKFDMMSFNEKMDLFPYTAFGAFLGFSLNNYLR